LGNNRLALILEKETEVFYMFRLYRLEEGDVFKELNIKLRITKIKKAESITYTLEFDAARGRDFFRPELEATEEAAVEVKGRLPVEDPLPYMLGWVDSDVAISKGLLVMTTSHLWQLAETHALFGWSVVGLRMSLTLEGPKLQVVVEAPLENLDEAVRRSAEGGWLKMLGIKAESWEGPKQWVVENWDVVVEAAVRRLGEGVRSKLEALRNKLNDDKVARGVVAPALLLIQAERLGVNEETLKYFAAAVSGAIGGDGYVSAAMKKVVLTSGEREIALLWRATLAAYGIETKARDAGWKFDVVASGGDAARLAGLYFLYGSPLLEGDERFISHKLAEAVKLGAEGLDIRWEGLRRTPSGHVAADLTISVGGTSIKYNVYLRDDTIMLRFQSTDQSRAELATRLLKLAGVTAGVKKVGDRDEWFVRATIDKLAAGREELRKALAEIVKTARSNDGVDEKKAKRWLEKLEKGRVLMEGWPKCEVRLTEGGLMIRFASTSPDSIERRAQQLRDMGLEEGVHFTVKMPEGGKAGYVNILKEGLAYAAWLSVNSEGEQQKLVANFVELILRRAEEADGGMCGKVCEKVEEIVEKGKAWGSQKLERFEKKVEVNGKTYVVKVRGGEAVEEGRGGRKLLRIKITAEVGRVEGEHIVDRVEREYTITYSRRKTDNATLGYATAKADAPGGREADAERLAAVIKALTGREPKVYQRSDGKIEIKCYEGHLEGFMLYKEFFGTIMQWLKDTSRRGRGADREGAEDAPQGGRHDNDKA
jgi:hypothetical protein